MEEKSKEIVRETLSKVVAAVRASQMFAEPSDYGRYSALETFSEGVEASRPEILRAMGRLLGCVGVDVDVEAEARKDNTLCGVYEDGIVAGIERFLDAVDNFTDTQNGQRALPSVVFTHTVVDAGKGAGENAKKVNVMVGRNVARPQDSFEDKVDNFPTGPWVPRIKEKPNAIVPLEDVFAAFERAKERMEGKKDEPEIVAPKPKMPVLPSALASHLESIGVSPDASRSTSPFDLGRSKSEEPEKEELRFPHPYQTELDQLEYQPWQRVASEPKMYGTLEETPLTFVNTPELLQAMESKLEKERIFAIDLEAHDYHSYNGITCLMQVSTRSEDFIVDTLALRSHMWLLNDSFTNPEIVKVLHGMDWDILWLQRDFGLYVVNSFDTGQASRVLTMESFGLKFLLHHYCGVEADKKYQLADWRIRPLPEEMLHYAREDTHYLLYIYDRMVLDLVTRAESEGCASNTQLIDEVLERSRRICLKRYSPVPPPDDLAIVKFTAKHQLHLTPLSQALLPALFRWRDTTARHEDESVRYVLPNHMLINIVQTVPESISDLLACCPTVPPLVRVRASEIVDLIKSVKKDFNKDRPKLDSKPLPPLSTMKPKHTVFEDEDMEGEKEKPKPEPKKLNVQKSSMFDDDDDDNDDEDEVEEGEVMEEKPAPKPSGQPVALNVAKKSTMFDDEEEEEEEEEKPAPKVDVKPVELNVAKKSSMFDDDDDDSDEDEEEDESVEEKKDEDTEMHEEDDAIAAKKAEEIAKNLTLSSFVPAPAAPFTDAIMVDDAEEEEEKEPEPSAIEIATLVAEEKHAAEQRQKEIEEERARIEEEKKQEAIAKLMQSERAKKILERERALEERNKKKKQKFQPFNFGNIKVDSELTALGSVTAKEIEACKAEEKKNAKKIRKLEMEGKDASHLKRPMKQGEKGKDKKRNSGPAQPVAGGFTITQPYFKKQKRHHTTKGGMDVDTHTFGNHS